MFLKIFLKLLKKLEHKGITIQSIKLVDKDIIDIQLKII